MQPLILSHSSILWHPLSSTPPAGIEPATGGLENRCDEVATGNEIMGCVDGPILLTFPLPSPLSADLARVAEAWPVLPEHIRLAVLALVESSRCAA